jgi:predicted lipase
MKSDIYSYVFRGRLAEEALDKAGRQKYHPEAIYFCEEIADKLHLNEIDEKYVQQSKSMITAFAAITAFENATRSFVYSVLIDAYKNDWWTKGIQNSTRTVAEGRRSKESKIRWHVNRGDEMMSYLDFGDLAKTMTSSDNWKYFEPYVVSQEWVKTLFDDIETSRNVIMHSGVLDEFDISRVGMNIRDWLRQINA